MILKAKEFNEKMNRSKWYMYDPNFRMKEEKFGRQKSLKFFFIEI